jgi:hypothetical protein
MLLEMVAKIPGAFERSWKWRRWAVFSQLAVIDAMLLYLTYHDVDNALNRDIVSGAYLFLAALCNGYIFGGIWDDKIKDNTTITATPGTIETKTSTVVTTPDEK